MKRNRKDDWKIKRRIDRRKRREEKEFWNA